MAKSATKENVRAGPSDLQWQSARNIIKQDIERAKKAQSKAGGDANAAWKRIEGMGINKAGAKFFASLYGQEPVVAMDILRTVMKLSELEGLLDKDLVEQAETGGPGDEDKDDGAATDTVPVEESAAVPVKRGRGRPPKPKLGIVTPTDEPEVVSNVHTLPTKPLTAEEAVADAAAEARAKFGTAPEADADLAQAGNGGDWDEDEAALAEKTRREQIAAE